MGGEPSQPITKLHSCICRRGEWLTDDQNRAEAATIYARYIPNTPDALIAKAREAMLSETEGFQPRAKFDPAGAQTALAVRKQYGVPKKDLPDWRTYVDETFYDEALKQSSSARPLGPPRL